MKYDLCSACVNFQPKMLTETESIPKSCNCPKLSLLFGPAAGGFPSGIDIIHCDLFIQHPAEYGDVLVHADGVHGVSYVLTQPRNFKNVRIPKLYNNSQNIKRLKIDYEKQVIRTEIEDTPF